MKKIVTMVLTLAIAFSTALAQEKDKDQKMQDLEKKIDALMTEIEIMKATSGSEEHKVEKFKMFGYFGTRFMDFNVEDDSKFPSGERVKSTPSFMQNNLNIYFQFTPIENWKVLSEIRFLYAPKGNALSTSPDAKTAQVLYSNKFRVNGLWVTNNGVLGNPNPNGVGLPITSSGDVAVSVNNAATGIDLTGDGAPDLPPAWYPIDGSSNYLISLPSNLPTSSPLYGYRGKIIRIKPSATSNLGTILGTADASDIIFTGSPVVKGVSMFDTEFPTGFTDPVSAINYNWGGLNIERAYMEWNYSDKMNFLAGKFLTPFGIWNVDHGLPVLLSARIPYELAFIPDTQVGIQTFGRINFPQTDLEYNVYISNGRDIPNPTFDNNKEKSIGGRLNLRLQSDMFKELAIGTSGYYGKHTDYVAEYKVVFDDSDFIVNQEGVTNNGEFTTSKIQIDRRVWSEFDEIDFGLDFKMAYKGLSLQSEFLYRSFDYKAWDQKYINQRFGSLFPPRKLPDITAFYVQSGYELPWKFKDVAFTPFVRYENIDGYIKGGSLGEAQGTPVNDKMSITTAGLNIRQNPYVIYKFDYTQNDFSNNKDLSFKCYTLSADIGF